jgi:hypothetical protein
LFHSSTTVLPLNSDRLCFWPLLSLALNSGAGAPTEAGAASSGTA